MSSGDNESQPLNHCLVLVKNWNSLGDIGNCNTEALIANYLLPLS